MTPDNGASVNAMKPGDFAAALFGADLPDGRLIHTWTLATKKSQWWRSAQGLDILAGRENVYIGVALAHKDHGASRRLCADEAIGIGGLWLDLDVLGGPEQRGHGAPDKAAAIELAGAVLEPTILVDSGWGVHAWHLLDDVWRFASRSEQSEAALLSARWYHLHGKLAREAGWHLDPSTRDLARIMRLPGTTNVKGGERAAVTVIRTGGPRYARTQLAHRTSAVDPGRFDVAKGSDPGVSSVGELRFSKGAAPPADRLRALLVNSPEFEQTWTRARPDFHDDQSRYDLALANLAVAAGWTDQDIATLIGAHRGWDPKSFRRDYIERTIVLAREALKAAA